MIVIQEMCARIGLVTGSGLAGIMKKRYSKKTVYPIISLLLIANTINIGADIGAMSASVKLVLPQLQIVIVTILFTALVICAEIFIPYRKYVTILKYLTLSLLAYVITAFVVGGNWNEILVSSVIPHFEFTPTFVMLFVAIFGTTLIRDQPQIDRISLAVMVDGTDSVGTDGKHTWQPRAGEELDRITTLVKRAIGFDEKRGDQVEVVSMRFAAAEAMPFHWFVPSGLTRNACKPCSVVGKVPVSSL